MDMETGKHRKRMKTEKMRRRKTNETNGQTNKNKYGQQ